MTWALGKEDSNTLISESMTGSYDSSTLISMVPDVGVSRGVLSPPPPQPVTNPLIANPIQIPERLIIEIILLRPAIDPECAVQDKQPREHIPLEIIHGKRQLQHRHQEDHHPDQHDENPHPVIHDGPPQRIVPFSFIPFFFIHLQYQIGWASKLRK